MAYLVKFLERAELDLAEICSEINAEDSAAALYSYKGLREAILSLEDHPNRCPFVPNSRRFRHLPDGNKPNIYRVIYRVLETYKRVEILHIRHGARLGDL